MTYKLQDLIDIEQFQMLQDRLNEIYSFPSAIIDNEGNILTATAWQDVCTQFHRKNKECEVECIKSDQYILSHLAEANPAVSYRCPHGLVDNATPIIIDGVHYGNFFTGQFFMEPPDLEFFKQQAQRYGFDEPAYLDAVKRAPIWNQDQLNSYLYFIKGLIEVISNIGLKNLRAAETRKQIEETEDYANTVLRQMHDAFWIVNRKGNILDVNPAMCSLTGYTREELLAMSIAQVDAKDFPELVARRIRRILRKGSDRFESQFQRKDGRLIDVDISITYLSERGVFFGFHRDITERKRAEKALRDTTAQLETLVQASPLAILALDSEGLLRLWNPAAEKIFGWTAAEIIGQPNPIIPAAHQAEYTRWIDQVLSGQPFVDQEAVRQRKDGSFVNVTVSSAPFFDAEGKPAGRMAILTDITERKRMKDELQKANLNLARAEQVAHVGGWENYLPTGELHWSDEMYRIMGFPIGSPVNLAEAMQCFPPDELTRFQQAMTSVIEHDIPYRNDYRIIRPDGQERYIHDEGIVVRDKSGQAAWMFGATQDITERKQEERALTHSHDLMRYIIEHNRSAVAVHDRDMKYIYVSQRYLEDYKVKERDVIGKYHYDVFPDLPQKWRDVHHRVLAGEVLSAEDDPYVREDGSVDWTRWECRPWYEADGAIGGLVVYTEVITERKQAEDALRASEEKYRMLVEQAADGIFVTDSNGNYLEANPSGCAMLGYTREELLKLNIRDLAGREDQRGILLHLKELHKGDVDISERNLSRKDGSLLQVEISSKKLDNGRLQGIVRDMTARKQAEVQLKKALAEKETLLRELYHRTKNNMGVISAILSLQAGYFDDERLQKVIEETQNRIRAMSLVHQELYEASDLSQINLKEYIQELTQLLLSSYLITPEQVSVASELEDVFVLIDTAIPCGLILNELISNALKYAFPGGRTGQISVKLRRIESGEIEIEVSDNGIGLPPGFDPRRDGRMGLQTIYGLAENQLQARIDFLTDGGLLCKLQFKDDLYQPRV